MKLSVQVKPELIQGHKIPPWLSAVSSRFFPTHAPSEGRMEFAKRPKWRPVADLDPAAWCVSLALIYGNYRKQQHGTQRRFVFARVSLEGADLNGAACVTQLSEPNVYKQSEQLLFPAMVSTLLSNKTHSNTWGS